MGNPIGNDFVVNTSTYASQATPSVTVLSDGRFVVTWTDYSLSLDPDGTGITCQIFSADGSKIGAEFGANTTTASTQRASVVTALDGGGFVVTWTDDSRTGSDVYNAAIRAQVFGADGLPVGTEFVVNSTTYSHQTDSAVTAMAGGGFLVTWTDYSGLSPDFYGSGLRGQFFDATGAKVGGEMVIPTTMSGNQTESAVIALAGGGFVVTWTDASQTGDDTSEVAIRGRVFDDSGTALGSDFVVNTTTSSRQEDSSVTALTDGGFVVTWTDYSASGDDTSSWAIRAQAFAADGSKSGDEIVVNTTTSGYQFQSTVRALADGRFVVSWTDDSATGGDTSMWAIRAQIFDARSAGIDLAGTAGNDEYYGTGFGDTIGGADGGDWLYGGDGSDTLRGGLGDDLLDGSSGDDLLYGQAGNNTLIGGGGNDRYFLTATSVDFVVETTGDGIDTILTPGSYTLGTGIDIERLFARVPGSTTALSLTGNALAQTIRGNDGANILDSATGADDTLIGGGGDDQFLVRNSGDLVIEKTGGGHDTVMAMVSHALAANARVEVLETGDAAGTTAIDLTGSSSAQEIIGNDGANRLDGRRGADTLTGNAGADTFVFSTVAGAGDVKTITDFAVGEDRMELSSAIFTGLTAGALSADALAVNTTGAAEILEHRLIYNSDSGDLFYDGDGVDGGRGRLIAHLTAGLALTAADFLVF